VNILTRLCLSVAAIVVIPAAAYAQKKTADLKSPEPGYVYPAGGQAGSTASVHLGGYDWTPDLQFFVLDPRVQLQTTAEPGPILVPPPPYWFGAKSTLAAPLLPREQPATITLPAGLPAGPVRWAVAGASGAGAKTGIFWVGDGPEALEDASSKSGQALPTLPVTVNGRLSRIEEVDRYRFTAPKAGPVTCEVFARRLGVNMNVAVTVRDAAGMTVADAVDTDGQDAAVTFKAAAGAAYTVSVNDLDFRGDRSSVYRLALTAGPRVVASVPAVGKRGESRAVEFVGYGLATGEPKLESVTRTVAFPADPKMMSLGYRVETPFGNTPVFDIPLGDVGETVAGPTITLPAAFTAVFDKTAKAEYACVGKKGDVWAVKVEARRFGSPLDLSLAVRGPDGKELMRNDDLPGTTDAGLTVTLPADGAYTLVVSDVSGRTGTRAAVYRLTAEKPAADFSLTTVARLNVPLGGKAELTVKADRKGSFKEPITLTVAGLPEGVTLPPSLVIPADKPELKIPLTAAETAPAVAALLTVTGTAGAISRPAFAPIPGDLTGRNPDGERTTSILVATTLTPRLKLVCVDADGGRKVHRGGTHPAEVTLERMNGFAGDVRLQMSAAQSYQRQGITGPDMTVPAKDDRAFYPCFMPEWLETTRTSRMELIGVVQVPDPKGRVRYLVTPMAGRITMSIEGSILKVDAAVKEAVLKPGESIDVPVTVLRSPKIEVPVTLTLKLPEEMAGAFTAPPVTVPPGQTTATVRITRIKGVKVAGEGAVTIRGLALQNGKYEVVSEATVTVECPKE